MPIIIKKNEIVRNTTAEILIEMVLDWIRSGELKIGDRLPPAQELATLFGVGRSSVREAIRALGALGYLDILPGKGTFIRKDNSFDEISTNGLIKVLESGTLFDILEARYWLEIKCAEVAAERSDLKHIKKMGKIIKLINADTADLETIGKADLEFHLLLAEATDNEVIYEIMKLLIEKVNLYSDKFWATVARDKNKAISTVSEVFYHVTRGEGKLAAESMQEHLDLVGEKLNDVIMGTKE